MRRAFFSLTIGFCPGPELRASSPESASARSPQSPAAAAVRAHAR
jgi:hypothetical protein